MTAFLILSPFLLVVPAAWFAGRFPRRAAVLALWPALLALVFGRALLQAVPGGMRLIDLPWAPSLGLTLSFNLDGLGLLFATLITGVGAAVVLYASRYLHGHPSAGRFFASLFGFMGAMLGVVLSDNVLTLFVFWELTGFTSFLLIGFDHERPAARAAAIQALIVTGAGGLALLAAGVLLVDVTGTPHLTGMAESAAAIAASPLATAIAVLVLLAAFTKSAQVPFHFWLPNAMEAPTPVSAYLHSATMVKAGVYLIARMHPLLGTLPIWTIAVPVAGAATMVVGAWRATQETDLKRILAYSTLSALGVLTMLLGVGTREAIAAALVYLVAHAAYKGALFMVAGAIDHETGTRDITRLGGLRRAMPVTAVAGLAAALSMAGLPLTLGFIGKDAGYEALLHTGGIPWLLALFVGASVLLGLAGLVAGVMPFHAKAPEEHAVHDPGWPMWLPPLALAALGLIVGLAPALLDGTITAAATAASGTPVEVHLAIWHGLTPALLLSLATLVGVALAYSARTWLRTHTWKPGLGSEDAYVGGLSALLALSRRIAPPLHSTSLRIYVMAIVLASFVIGGTAYVSGPSFDTLAPQTRISSHDVFVVIVIVGGALATTFAKTTMAAVLALGAVGYGVAMVFLSFGAPDLAMTQFSVETLTVLIYVLVFRHFRTLGALSPPVVRMRDTLVASAIGLFIATLLLTVSTMDTAPRLKEYFATFGPTLGHGRNIVNVILVDFRAFDTFGEITVLSTAAIGVFGLLRIAVAEGTPHAPVNPVSSSIFRTAARVLMPLLLLFAVFLFLRGHNQPGGGFVGGLVAAAAFALYGIGYGTEAVRRALLVSPIALLGAGLMVALVSGVPAVAQGLPFLTAWWPEGLGAFGSPVVFDIGVFLVVTGVVLMMFLSLAEEG